MSLEEEHKLSEEAVKELAEQADLEIRVHERLRETKLYLDLEYLNEVVFKTKGFKWFDSCMCVLLCACNNMNIIFFITSLYTVIILFIRILWALKPLAFRVTLLKERLLTVALSWARNNSEKQI